MRVIIILLILIPSLGHSQIEKVSKFLEIGISPLSYKGDLSQGYQKWTSGFHIGLKRNTKKRINGHFNLMIGSITGQKINYTYPASSSTPNNFFKSSLISLNYSLHYNLIKKDRYIIYISQGIGLIRFTTKDENGNDLSDKINTRAKNETYNNIAIILPHSIGFMYFLKNNYGAGIQFGRLSPTTDYLDNISQLSYYKKPDNIIMFKFSFLAPISYKKEKDIILPKAKNS